MCLSKVYIQKGKEKQELCDNIMLVKTEAENITLVDILGRPTVVKGSIEHINLMDNFIIIKPAN